MKRRSWLAFTLILCLNLSPWENAVAQNAAVADRSVGNAVSVSDKDVPGVGPIRREDWFQEVWRDRRAKFAEQTAEQEHALVFFGDSITQGWGDDFGGRFPGVKVANRGISGDTTRGLLARLDDDVLALDPQGIVLLDRHERYRAECSSGRDRGQR